MTNDGITAHDLAELMVGSELPTPDTSESTVTDEVALELRDLTVRNEDGRQVVHDINLRIHRGEIVGIAGVEGNGQGELVDAIIGTADISNGSIKFHGRDITTESVRKRREAGVAYVPEDRHHEGLLLSSPLWENAALGHQTQAPYGSTWWLDRVGARKQTERIREQYDVRTPNIDVSAHALSGGNQQKLIIGRELTSDPEVLIAAHPTRGIDVGAQAAVWDDIRAARRNGLATLLISADLDELIGLSDTIVVMLRGEFVATLSPDEVTPRDLGAYMTGAALQNGGGRLMRKISFSLAAPVGAFFLTLVVSTIALMAFGSSPTEAYGDMLSHASKLETQVDILNRATPFYLSAVAAAIGFRMNLFNIGVEGQYLMGFLFAAQVGGLVSLPQALHILVIMLTAMIVSSLYAGLAGILKTTRGVNEVISTIMLNAIAIGGLIAWLQQEWQGDLGENFSSTSLGTKADRRVGSLADHQWAPRTRYERGRSGQRTHRHGPRRHPRRRRLLRLC